MAHKHGEGKDVAKISTHKLSTLIFDFATCFNPKTGSSSGDSWKQKHSWRHLKPLTRVEGHVNDEFSPDQFVNGSLPSQQKLKKCSDPFAEIEARVFLGFVHKWSHGHIGKGDEDFVTEALILKSVKM